MSVAAASAPRTVLMTADTIGGVWTFALGLTRALSSHGVRVALATMGRPLSPDQWADARELENLDVVESSYRLEWMAEPWAEVGDAGKWLLSLEERFRPDLIHLSGYAHGALPWRAPVLITGHSCVLSWWEAVKGERAPAEWAEYETRVRRGLHAARRVAAPTAAMLAALRLHYGPLPPAFVVPNGADPARYGATRKEPFILAAGRLGDEAKNVAALGAVAGDLAWPVLVAGSPEDASGHAPLPPNLQACGFLPPGRLAERMGEAAIYCLPARYEPFGLSILEAALSGCALVLGDIPSLRELWDGAALFVPPNDPAELRGALSYLIDHPALRAGLGQAARERGEAFTLARMAAGYLALYRALA